MVALITDHHARILQFSDFVFFFNDTATTEIYTLSLHDALPIFFVRHRRIEIEQCFDVAAHDYLSSFTRPRSEEHTSELQSQSNLVCRLLLEKKKQKTLRSLNLREHIPGSHGSARRRFLRGCSPR